MGSVNVETEDELTVLITGFGVTSPLFFLILAPPPPSPPLRRESATLNT